MEIATIATISLVATAAAAAVSAVGAAYAGEAQSQAYKYKAGVAKVNEQIAKQNAEYSLKAGEYEAYRQGMKTRFQMGQITATQAGRGLDIRGGTTAQVVESQHNIGLQDQGLIRANAAKRAHGHEVEAVGLKSEQNLYGLAATTSKTAGYLGATASILGGVGSVSGKWVEAKNAGVYSGGNPTDVGSATYY